MIRASADDSGGQAQIWVLWNWGSKTPGTTWTVGVALPALDWFGRTALPFFPAFVDDFGRLVAVVASGETA